MPGGNHFIRKTSDLTEAEVKVLREELRKHVQNGVPLAVYFRNRQGFSCFNVDPHRKSEWDHLWGAWKSRFCQARRRAACA